MIKAGEIGDIRWSNGTWLILDIGFSNKSRSCGLLLHDGKPKSYQFSEAVREVIEILKNYDKINLVIEAPLSIAFDKYGNPKGRTIERQGSQTRYWYVGSGCVVMLATLHLIKRILDSHPNCNIRLFEGLVSYKSKGKKSDHLEDVVLLREAIQAPNNYVYIYEPKSLLVDTTDKLECAFSVTGMDFGIPPVIHGAKGG